MKMHSYMTTNGQLQATFMQSQMLLSRLFHLTQSFGGWHQAISDAKAHKLYLDELAGVSHSSDVTPNGTPEVILDGISVVDAPIAAALRQRLVAASSRVDSAIPIPSKSSPFRPAETHPTDAMAEPPDASGVHDLVDHPNEDVSSLAKELSELLSELTSSGPNSVRWPDNITYKNFAVYQLIPTLVYELEYPRTDRYGTFSDVCLRDSFLTSKCPDSIRPIYLFEKTVATFGTFALLYTVTERFILPLTPTSDQSFFHSLLDLALPFMMAYLLLFYIIFGKPNLTSVPIHSRILTECRMHL